MKIRVRNLVNRLVWVKLINRLLGLVKKYFFKFKRVNYVSLVKCELGKKKLVKNVVLENGNYI